MEGEAAHTTCHKDFTITNQRGNQDFIRHLALMEPSELTGREGDGFTLSDVFKYVQKYVLCIFTIEGRRQQVVGSSLNALIGALLVAQLLAAYGKQKVEMSSLKHIQW